MLDLSINQIDEQSEKILEEAWAFYYADQQNKFLNCMALYHGQRQVNSLLSCLPPEMLFEIYRYILPATPILAKMTEISAKVFLQQFVSLKISDTSMHAKQLDEALKTALSAKTFTKKTANIKTAISHFLQQELEVLEAEKVAQFPTVKLFNKYHLIAGNSIQSMTFSRKHSPDEPEGQPLLKRCSYDLKQT